MKPHPLTVLRWAAVAFACAALALLLGCAHTPQPSPCTVTAGQSHNSCGGYVPACGNLPPLVGDDC